MPFSTKLNVLEVGLAVKRPDKRSKKHQFRINQRKHETQILKESKTARTRVQGLFPFQLADKCHPLSLACSCQRRFTFNAHESTKPV